VADTARIEELRRRVEKDPASILFAQLAEEHRRAGEYEDAIRVCRQGLAHHPDYLSARVTLGRALLETAQFDDARNELEQVVRVAPDNLAAIRALAAVQQRGEAGAAQPTAAHALDPEPSVPEPPSVSNPPSAPSDPVVTELEGWLDAIAADRQHRRTE
jgi:tetratricopeptide (TPR) repeat protein